RVEVCRRQRSAALERGEEVRNFRFLLLNEAAPLDAPITFAGAPPAESDPQGVQVVPVFDVIVAHEDARAVCAEHAAADVADRVEDRRSGGQEREGDRPRLWPPD